MLDPSTFETIDYDAVAASYREGLLERLRGFQGGHGFLEAWVDHEDPVEALFGLFEAARGAGLAGLAVVVGAARSAGLDRGRLDAALTPLGESALVGDGPITVTLRFGAPATPSAPRHRPSPLVGRPEHPAPAASVGPAVGDSWELGPTHGVAARLAQAHASHEGALGAVAPGAIRASAHELGVTLEADVDPAVARVVRARFRGAPDDAARGLLEVLCAQAEAVPLRELADHGVVRVEHALRSRRPVGGIVLPDNAGPAFAAAERLVRALVASTGLALPIANRYDAGVGPTWASLAPEAQREAVERALERLSAAEAWAPRAVTCRRVEGGERVVVVFDDAVPAGERPGRLMGIEAALQRSVEPGLYVLTEERRDANPLRRL